MPEWGALLLSNQPYGEMLELACALEEWGFSSFWYADEKYYRDCYMGLALVASRTKRMRLGPCVTDPYSRHPIQTAVSIGSLLDLAPGRVCLGIGAGGRGLAEIGINPQRPAVAIREAIEMVKALLRGDSVTYSGQLLSLKDRPLDFKPQGTLKFMIGTGHGKHIQQLAGEIADIAMLANYATPETISTGLSQIEQGARKATRSLKDLELIARIDVAVSANGRQAEQAVAPRILSAFRSSYPNLSYLEALPEFDMSSRFIQVLNQKDYATKRYYSNPEHSAPLIPRVLTERMAIAGTPEQVAERLTAISDMKVFQEITVAAVPCANQTLFDALRLFAKEVIPQVTR